MAHPLDQPPTPPLPFTDETEIPKRVGRKENKLLAAAFSASEFWGRVGGGKAAINYKLTQLSPHVASPPHPPSPILRQLSCTSFSSSSSCFVCMRKVARNVSMLKHKNTKRPKRVALSQTKKNWRQSRRSEEKCK